VVEGQGVKDVVGTCVVVDVVGFVGVQAPNIIATKAPKITFLLSIRLPLIE
jgi:hypothetical protein